MYTYIHTKKIKTKYSHVNFIDVQMADGKVGFNPPVSFLTEISNDIHGKLMVWYVNCFTIFTSNDCWRPPPYVLQLIEMEINASCLRSYTTCYCF